MKYHLFTRDILHQLGLNKNYSGFDYILYGIFLISENEELLSGITKILYVEIAVEFNTTSTCVEKNIRKAIETIWNDTANKKAILKIFGQRYEKSKPSNKIFLELIYEFIKKYKLLEELASTNKMVCPILKDTCQIYNEVIRKLFEL